MLEGVRGKQSPWKWPQGRPHPLFEQASFRAQVKETLWDRTEDIMEMMMAGIERELGRMGNGVRTEDEGPGDLWFPW